MKIFTRTIAGFCAASMIVVIGAGRVYAGGEGNDGRNKPRFTFALWGDTPYSPDQISKIAALTADINASKVEFAVFDGDIKSGSIRRSTGSTPLRHP